MSVPEANIDKLYFNECGTKIESSYNYHNKPGVYDWLPSDTEEKFLDNKIKYENSYNDYFKKSIEFYLKNPITYAINDEGFRDDPWDTKPNGVDVYLGCSFTSGIGIHLEHTWPYKLSQYTNYPAVRAGMGGSGCVSHYRFLITLAQRFKIRNVYYLADFSHNRLEWYYESLQDSTLRHYLFLNPHDPHLTPEHYENILNEKNRLYLIHCTFYAMKGFCREHNLNFIPIIQQDFHYFRIDFLEKIKNNPNSIKQEFKFDNSLNFAARDLSHPPILDHHIYYLNFLEKLGVNIYNS